MDIRDKQGRSPVNVQVWRHRRDTIVAETGHDAYRQRRHLHEPSVCPGCEAVYHDGRWTWTDVVPSGAEESLCPACRRAGDGYPAGFLSLSGPFFLKHQQEILNLVENVCVAETAEHPLNRKLATEATPGGVVLETTDVHLCRRVGEALHHAYGGDLEYEYAPDDSLVRATWTR